MHMSKSQKAVIDIILGVSIYILTTANVYFLASKYGGDAFKVFELTLGGYSF